MLEPIYCISELLEASIVFINAKFNFWRAVIISVLGTQVTPIVLPHLLIIAIVRPMANYLK